VVAFALASAATAGCKSKTPVISEPFVDGFDRVEIGPGWLDTSGGKFRIRDGKLNVQGALNHPLWLRKRLPRDVVVEVDVISKSAGGDIKLELYGDGESFDPDQNDYSPTGYVFVFGGWENRESIIGKLYEHADGVKAIRKHRVPAPGTQAGDPPGQSLTDSSKPVDLGLGVVPGRTYHWVIQRKGALIDWKIEGQPFLSWTDPAPLYGEEKSYLGFNNWESDVYFDNLSIRPAP
jgi:hypothetical protein